MISQYFLGKRALSHWEEMQPGRSYIFGKVADTGAIIEGGGSAAHAGHIAITEPNRFRKSDWSTPPAVFVVESTVAHNPGLWGSWYSLQSMHETHARVFRIYREDMIAGHQRYPFRIAEV